MIFDSADKFSLPSASDGEKRHLNQSLRIGARQRNVDLRSIALNEASDNFLPKCPPFTVIVVFASFLIADVGEEVRPNIPPGRTKGGVYSADGRIPSAPDDTVAVPIDEFCPLASNTTNIKRGTRQPSNQNPHRSLNHFLRPHFH
ncbi:hypothetical protein BLNAU_25196 [Blattamonas nauphoetae]|uniref:Uncharacterized protein n=1 Tax=Blattamonas nauphoetae TaxID=2049346 RepID=A0ABQ9WL40_9EUKA|nr:hypothetical protein BLNAU_25196 [Blattamonas nauphoetae]